jgi:UDP-GlcNAc:undecaprenyl-phosphate GlcNAc-1-phosphate transferase
VILLTAVFAVATITSIIAGAFVRRVAPTIGAVVPPRADRWHRSPTPTLGGIAIVIGTAGGFAAIVLDPELLAGLGTWSPVVAAAVAMFAIGVLDDRLQLSPVAKLVASLAIGAFLVFALAGRNPDTAAPIADTLVAILWFAGMCHAWNLLDNMDGLAAGSALIAAAMLAWLLPTQLGSGLVVFLTALSGALLGFYYWNRPQARLFMGDSGSLFIGAALGGASLVPVLDSGISFVSPSVLVLLILVVPLFDTSFVLLLRRLAGRSATRGGTDHVSHRLVSLGFSERSAVRILYGLGLFGGAAAWALRAAVLPPLPVVSLFVVMVILLGIYLARVPAYNADDFIALQKSTFAPFLKDLAFRWHAGQVMMDLVLITVCYYAAYRLRFEGESFDNFLPYFTASLPVVLGCQLASLYVSGLYLRSWDTFGLRDGIVVIRAVGLCSMFSVISASYLYRFEGFSYGVFLIDAVLLMVAITATRASFRTMNLVAATRSKRSTRVLVYGAGAFGQLLAREMRANADWNMNPVAFLDDDPAKVHRWIGGVPVRGALEALEETMRKYSIDEVILSSPAINGSVEHSIREVCHRLDRRVRRLHMEIR